MLEAVKEAKPDRLGKFRLHLLGEKSLNQEDQKRFERMTEAHAMAVAGYTRSQIASVLSKKWQVEVVTVYRTYHDAMAVFGHASDTIKAGLRQAMHENFIRMAQKAEKQDKLELAGKLYNKAAQILGLYNFNESMDYSKMFMLNITFTTDPKALKNNQQDKVIDISHEEIDE